MSAAARAEERGQASALEALGQALLVLREAGDFGAASAIAGGLAAQALGAREHRLLRVDTRTGALLWLDESGTERPWVAESDGPVHWVLRHETPRLDEDARRLERLDAGLLLDPPGALATVPLLASGAMQGVLLLGFAAPRRFAPAERALLEAFGDALALAFERHALQRAVGRQRRLMAGLEQRVQENAQASSHLMSVVAHEIRSPLTAIKAYSEALLDSRSDAPAPRERFLGIINDECDRLARLVADILDLSRLEAGHRPLRLARLGVQTLVRETVETLTPVAGPRRIQFELDLPPDLVVEADADMLRRLLVNLAGNAIKYSPAAGRVRIEARGEGDDWTASVTDQGPGIPAEDLGRVFDCFYRSRPAERQVEGHGLGLAIARGIVEAHGGRIWAERHEPTGTRLSFTLPRRHLASTRARAISRQISRRPGVRALLEHGVDVAAAAVDAAVVSLMLVDPDQGDLIIVASRGLEGHQLLGRRGTFRAGVAGTVAASGAAVLVDDIETDHRFRRLNHPQYVSKSLLCAPLRVEGEVLGVFNVTCKLSGEAFDQRDLAVMTALIERIGALLEQVRTHPDQELRIEDVRASLNGVSGLERASADPERVADLARSVALALGMEGAEAERVVAAASIPGEPAAPRVQGQVRVETLRPSGYLKRIEELLVHQHEWWDGSGLPSGLAGDSIPLGARILAAVGCYRRILMGGACRPVAGGDGAFAELRSRAGTRLDPRVVESLIGLAASREVSR